MKKAITTIIQKFPHLIKGTRLNNFRLPRTLTNLKSKLLVLCLVLGLIPLLLFGNLVYLDSQSELRSSTYERMDQVAQLLTRAIDQWLTERQDDMSVLANMPALQNMDLTNVGPLVQQYFKQWKSYENMSVIDPHGMTIYRTDDKVLDLSDRAYFQQAIQGEAVISDPVISKGSGDAVIVVAQPIKKDGKIVGVVTGAISTNRISSLLKIAFKDQTAEAYLVNFQGYFVTAPRTIDQLKKDGLIKNQAEMEIQVSSRGIKRAFALPGVDQYENYYKKQVVGAYRMVVSSGWGLLVEQETSEAFASIDRLRIMIVGFTLGAALIIILTAFYFAHQIASPIKKMAKIANQIAEIDLNNIASQAAILATGDLTGEIIIQTQPLTHHSADEIGDLSASFNEIISHLSGVGSAYSVMKVNLTRLIRDIQENATDLRSASNHLIVTSAQAETASGQIDINIQQVTEGIAHQTESSIFSAASVKQLTSAVQVIALGAQDQSAAVMQASREMEKVDQYIDIIFEKSRIAADAAGNSAQMSQMGARSMDDLFVRMQSIKTKTQSAGNTVNEMDLISSQIGVIVETIDDIASQTNLLALNAAIEAAHAGNYGRGFAVVADEVRKLAEKSALAAKNISRLIHSVQTSAKEAEQAVAESLGEVEIGVQQAQLSGQTLTEIFQVMQIVSQKTQETDQAMHAMRQVYQELSSAIQSVSAVTEENTASTKEMTTSSEEASRLISSISGISQKNKRAADIVTLSIAEMKQYVDHFNQAAHRLAQTEGFLHTAVAKFII